MTTIPIDECLFGPDKICPPTVCNNNNNDKNGSPHYTPPRRSTTATLPDRPQKADDSTKNHHVNLQQLRRTVSQGIVDKGSHRPVAWRVLLGYLPPDTSQWKELLERERALYQTLVDELFVSRELDKSQLCGHHSKRVNEMKQQQEEESLIQQETIQPPTKQRRASLGYIPTFTENTTLPRAKSLGDLSSHHHDDLLSEHSNRTRELFLANERVENRSERTRTFLKTIGMVTSLSDDDESDESSDCTPPHSNREIPIQQDNGYCDLVPAQIKEQWKRSGRDQSSLVRMAGGGSIRGMNTLLVVDEGNNTTFVPESSSKWQSFYENASLLDEIRKDVVRTHPDLFFFLEPNHNLGQRRYAAIERILFVWAKLNKGVRYVQGMNEIVGTLYYVLANDCNKDWACNAEADAYFLFNILLVEMRDVFVPDLDEADTGIQGRISNLVSLLELHDPEVSAHLFDCGIDASFYAIRWLTTLLSREFLLPDTIRLWDSMFASTHKDNFLRYVCVTMVMIVRKDLLKGDFSTCLRLLQSYPPTNVDDLLESSRALWIYESQVTLACHKGGISLQKALHNIAPPPAILMAYGYPGGVTFKHSDRTQGEKDTASSSAKYSPKKGVSSPGFMSQAKGYLGDIGKRYKNSKQR